MATTFTYRVRDGEGQLRQGSVEADSTSAVANRLRSMGLLPISIEEERPNALQKELTLPFANRISPRDVAVFSRQFATMINGGLSLIRALQILSTQTENKALATIVGVVRLEVERGSSLSQALARYPKAFSRLYVSMVKAGEVGGVLDTVLLQLADMVEKQVELRRKIKSAMTYPVAVLGLVLVIVIAMLVFVVPTFEGLYKDLGGTLPAPTRILLNVSSVVTRFAPVLLLGAVAGAFGMRHWVSTENGRAVFDAFKLRMPIFGKLVHKTALTRFSRTLSVLLRSGVPILEAMEITSETVNNTVVSRAIHEVQERVQRGETIAGPLAEQPVFPAMVTQMLAVGEETGGVDTMLLKVAEFYEQEVEATVEALTSLLEPMLIVVLGGCVGGMVVALYLPMFKIINLVQ